MNHDREDALRLFAGGSVSLLGAGLLSIPLYDIWEDVTDLSWALLSTLAENALFLVLAGSLIAGGAWLVRADRETAHVLSAARRTLFATGAIAALMGWAAFVQLQVMHEFKPAILGLNGVLIGAATSFTMAVSSVGLEKYRESARAERTHKEQVVALHDTVVAIKGATTRTAALDRLEDGIDTVLGDDPFRIVLDGEVVVDHGTTDAVPDEPTERVPVGSRGHVELLGGPVEHGNSLTAELLASHLDAALKRIEREESLRDERNLLTFVNRTLRHDLTSDLTLVRARLRLLDRNDAVRDETQKEHLRVALNRVDEMNDFVTTMRTYMESVLGDDHSLAELRR